MVATEAGLAPIPDQLVTLTGPFQLDGERTSVEGAAADAGLAAHFDSRGNPALQAAHFLADLAVLYLDLPGEDRGVVALAPRDWRLDRVFLDTVVAGLARPSRWWRRSALDTLFTDGPARHRPGRAPRPPPGGRPRRQPHRAWSTRSAASATASTPSAPSSGATNAVSGDLGERLLVAQSADFRSARQRDPYLAGVQEAIDEQLGGIEMPQNRSITLTARRGEIPVTFQNHTGHPVRVVVRMESDKLDFPRGETLEIDLTRLNTTHRFPVVARTSGAFPIRITLLSPDGDLVVGRARLTVRSTATSGVGLAISVGAALFLALWWGRHAQRGRRAKRLMEPSAVLAARGDRGDRGGWRRSRDPPPNPSRNPSPRPLSSSLRPREARWTLRSTSSPSSRNRRHPARLRRMGTTDENRPVPAPGTLGGG